jgi:hypothetical protein
MTESDPLALRPDPALGHLLREGLAGTTPDAALAARVRGALASHPRDSSWDVLSAWMRPGLAAAALAGLAAALAALFGAGAGEPEPATLLEETLAAGGPAVVTAEAPPTADEMLATLIDFTEEPR